MTDLTQDCPRPDQLRRLIDGSPADPSSAAVVAHLDGCAFCREQLEKLTGFDAQSLSHIKQTNETAVPDSESAFWPRLKSIEQEIQSPDSGFAATREDVRALDRSPSAQFDFLDTPDDPEHLGKLDRFQIVNVVGRGGMGVVFRAVDSYLQRTVAVKVLDPQASKTELAQSRFCREARAAAGVVHENVVTIHHVESDADRGLSYIVMQFVQGRSLQDILDESGPLPVREALRIASATASGLAAAHRVGLIHRDIKPGNILIENETGRVLLTDFGLARAIEDVKITQTGFVAGTPLYMSPEQAKGESLDHQSDLFSLGGVLYAMLTGKPPFEGSSPFVVLRQVAESRHRTVTDVNPAVPESVSELVDRLLAKNPKDRYPSAAAAAEAIEAVRATLPREQLPRAAPSRLTRSFRSWWRRRSGQMAMAALLPIATFLLAETCRLTAFTVIGQRGRPPVERIVEVPVNGTGTAGDSADAKDTGDIPAKFVLKGEAGAVWAVAFDPCGELMVTGSEDGTIKLWDPRDGRIRGTLSNYNSPVWAASFNADGTQLATASDDGKVRIWDMQRKVELKELAHAFPVRCVSFSPDGKKLISGTRNGAVTIWNVETGEKSHVTDGHQNGVVMAVAFASDNRTAASAGSDRTVRIWDTDEGREIATLKGHIGPVYAVAFHPDGKTLASAGWDHALRIWDVNTGEKLKSIDVHRDDIWALAFMPDGHCVLTGGQDHSVRCVELDAEMVCRTFKGHSGPVHGVAVSKDGKLIASGGRDGTVLIRELP